MENWPGQLTALLLSMLLLAGCGNAESDEAAERVLIMAAASTQDALEELARLLRERGGPVLVVNPGGSNALAQQIIAGAPGSLFLSASPEWADEVQKHGHAAERVALLSGRLVIVVPADNRARIQSPLDLITERVRHVALAGERVPAGMYGKQALETHGIHEQLAQGGRIVRGQNVRFTLAYVERGEVDAGIVYASDAAIASHVRVVYTFAESDHQPIEYPLVLLNRGRTSQSARDVFTFLQSPEAGEIFSRYGFKPSGPSADAGR